jgi:hypothetical protein
MTKGKSKCVVKPVDVVSRKGRDPFAQPGGPGNRWVRFGCDGEIPKKYKGKVEKAVRLAYALNNKKVFTDTFDKILSKVAKGKARSYLDALNAMTLNYAETSGNPIVKKEMKEALAAKKADSQYQIEGGFTIGITGKVYIREFVLKDWSETEIAGLISHEAAHIGGAPPDILTELILAALDQYGYRRHP